MLMPAWPGLKECRWQTGDNPTGLWRDAISDDTVVLHLAYSSPADVSAKARRSCPVDHLEAARRGDRAKVGAGQRGAGPTGGAPWRWHEQAGKTRICERLCTAALQVKECFVIDFDADAYIAAAQGPAAAEDFFFSRMVLSEGARLRCTDPALNQQVRVSGGSRRGRPTSAQFPHARVPVQGWCTITNVRRLIYLLEKVGLYRRMHAPSALLRQQEREIRRRMAQNRTIA